MIQAIEVENGQQRRVVDVLESTSMNLASMESVQQCLMHLLCMHWSMLGKAVLHKEVLIR